VCVFAIAIYNFMLYFQVGKDFINQARVALDLGCSDQVEAEAEIWRKVAEAHWHSEVAHTGEATVKKIKRVKSFTWLVASEAMLKHVAGLRDGWLTFRVREQLTSDLPPNPKSWPSLSLAIDQGTDGWCAANYLCNELGCNVTVLKDGAHRCWNDVCLALKASSLWFLVMAFNVVCSCDHGPWQDARWYTEAKEAADTYVSLTSPSACPLYREMYPKILVDKGISSSAVDDEMFEQIWRAIPEATGEESCATPPSFTL